jgi:hypothetical protein
VTLAGFFGTSSNDGREFFQPSVGSISPVVEVESRLSKEQQETLQLERFMHSTQSLPENLRYGTDFRYCPNGKDLPPDFLTSRDGLPLSLDVTRFSLPKLMQAAAELSRFHARLSAVPASDLSHLAGFTIRVAFRSASQLPARGISDVDLDELLQQIAGLQVDFEGFSTFDGAAWVHGLAQAPSPMNEAGALSSGAIEWYVSGVAHELVGSRLYGPSIEYAFPDLAIYGTDIREELDRLIAEHDSPVNDELVIVSSAPTADGLALLADTVALNWYVDSSPADGLVTPPHSLKGVWLLAWPTGRLDRAFER